MAFQEHAKRHYRRDDGTNTTEVNEYLIVANHVSEQYGLTPAMNFGPLSLKAVRQKFIDAGWGRRTINQRTGRIKRVFKWAVGEELVPPSVYQSLTAVNGLQRGRTSAKEHEPVEPVDDATVDATLPHVSRHIRGMIELQRLTVCRPGEVARIRRADIDTSKAVWLYKPDAHKTAWRGKTRTIPIGPRAQELLQGFFTTDPNDFLFSPRRAMEEYQAERSRNRKTPRWPSHITRNGAKRITKPKRAPAEFYDGTSFAHAVAKACKRFGIPHWHPNQLRHTGATRVRKEFGLEAAQVLLGHSRADVTQVYAERNETLAVSIATKIG
ncbi:Tyrosine recombinase XerC [Gemmata sp. SH-PL17]|uniref:tyrosine-type recombinase/integrase n=1 Tax=Gemmata sp. SH-PL17 TaxID=1630693 RepID=UPI00078C9FB2|nr:site-specific integrase [Gemmata sp. SH-PL17]AMV27385.1 Tyrosine recombinase XerC [Gemmata sp. SH-PL17]